MLYYAEWRHRHGDIPPAQAAVFMSACSNLNNVSQEILSEEKYAEDKPRHLTTSLAL